MIVVLCQNLQACTNIVLQEKNCGRLGSRLNYICKFVTTRPFPTSSPNFKRQWPWCSESTGYISLNKKHKKEKDMEKNVLKKRRLS